MLNNKIQLFRSKKKVSVGTLQSNGTLIEIWESVLHNGFGLVYFVLIIHAVF